MKKLKKYILVLLSPLVLVTGCELAGLDRQKKYDFDENAGILSNELNKSTWDFLNSRPELFSSVLEAIKYTGLEDKYNQPNSTYLVLTNTAVTLYLARNPLPNPNFNPNDSIANPRFTPAFSIDQLPKDKVTQMLLYHIVKGSYSWNNLPPVPTWYETNSTADNAKVNLYLMKNDRSPTIGFNSFPTHYQNPVTARTTNLKANTGSFVHVLDFYLDYPSSAALADR